MKSVKAMLALAMVCGVASAAVVFEDDFSSYASGSVIGGPDWQAKWDGSTTNNTYPQLLLFTATNGYAKLDLNQTLNNYNIVGQNGFSVGSNQLATVQSEMRFTHTGEALLDFNQPSFALLLSTTANWWSGTNATVNFSNRSGAWGSRLPQAPWIEGWNSWSELGFAVNPNGSLVASTSDWFRVTWTIQNGVSNYMASAEYTDLAGNSLHSTTEIELKIPNGTTLYAGYTTDYNEKNGTNMPTAIATSIDELDVDNFAVNVSTIPTTKTIFSDDFENPAYLTYPNVVDWHTANPWDKALNNPSGFVVTNGVLKQNIGWRGAAVSGYPFAATTGEIIRVAFDLTIDLGATFASPILCDYMLVPDGGAFFTNYVNPAIYYDDTTGSSGLSRRVSFNAWTGGAGEFPNGRMVVQLAGGTAEYYLAEDLGLAPGDGTSFVSDPLRMTFEYTKQAIGGNWECVTIVSNMSSQVSLTSTQTLTSATAYDASDLFFAMQQSGIVANGGITMDNFLGQISSGQEIILVGYAKWASDLGVTEGPSGDDDLDGMINLYEYALGGDPKSNLDQGTLPTMTYGATVSYTHPVLTDPKADVIYTAEWTENLSGTWSSVWDVDSSSATANPDYNERLLQIDGSAKNNLFLRLNITQP